MTSDDPIVHLVFRECLTEDGGRSAKAETGRGPFGDIRLFRLHQFLMLTTRPSRSDPMTCEYYVFIWMCLLRSTNPAAACPKAIFPTEEASDPLSSQSHPFTRGLESHHCPITTPEKAAKGVRSGNDNFPSHCGEQSTM
jgi:hypothetical protein